MGAIMSCQKFPDASELELDVLSAFNSTKSQHDVDYSVSKEGVEAYAKFKKLAYGKTLKNVTPFPEEGETALYIVNYDSGWELISADKRSTIVLGESDKGEFSVESDNSIMFSWVEVLADEILALKKIKGIPEDIEKEDKEIIKNNLKFWNCIEGNINNNGARPLTKTEIDPDDFGYWELVCVEVDSTFYDAPPRLTTTQWYSIPPYNIYYKRGMNQHIDEIPPAGSVAVAGAQMAYYLHNSIGRPETAYGKAEMILQDVDEDFWYDFVAYYLTDETSLIWPYMANNSLFGDCYSASILILEIEYATYSMYDDYSQYRYADINTNLQYLVNYFREKGVSCTLRGFNEDDIAASLLEGFPVVTSINTTNQNERNRRCFLIDGYKRYDVTYTYIYEWHNEDGSPSEYEPDVVVDNVGLQVSQYCMNWGDHLLSNDHYFVSSASGWLVGNNYYQYKGNIISGFSLMD